MRKLFTGFAWSQFSEIFVDNFEGFNSTTESVPCGTTAESALLLDNKFESSLGLALLIQRALTTLNLSDVPLCLLKRAIGREITKSCLRLDRMLK